MKIEILTCVDRDGLSVTLDESIWLDHVLDRHPYLTGWELAVRDIVSALDVITQDADVGNRRCLYGRSPLP
jgi:hypothetical protein